MAQGTITTVINGQARSCEAGRYVPAEVDIDRAVAATNEAQARPVKRRRNVLTLLFIRLGRAIKRYFTYNPEGRNPRAWELDVMRGVILLAVTLDHCLYYGGKEELIPAYTVVGFWFKHLSEVYCSSAVRRGMQPFGLWFIAFLSGMNSSFTRSKFHRVFKFWILCVLFMGGYALLHILWSDLVTASFVFNIIAVLTICFTFWWVLDIIKCPYWLRGYLGALLIVAGITYYYKYYVLDSAWVENKLLALLVYNQHGRDMSPQNFEPLLPHLGFFLVGGVLGKYLYPDRKTKCKKLYPPKMLTPVLLIGKHSLAAYLVLPFIILGIVKGISALIGIYLG